MKKILIFTLSFIIYSCSSSQKAVSNAKKENPTSTVSNEKEGSSFENAIVIKAKNEQEGVDAEYNWLKKNYPGCKSKGQSLSSKGSKSYDILRIVTSEGVEKTIYFDITNFFGKF